MRIIYLIVCLVTAANIHLPRCLATDEDNGGNSESRLQPQGDDILQSPKSQSSIPLDPTIHTPCTHISPQHPSAPFQDCDVCEAKSEGLVHYPTTLAPVSGSVTVTAQCADNANTTNTTSLQVTCNQNGNWSGEIPICFCNEGYQEVTIRGGHLCQISSDKSVPSDSDQNNICNGCEVITPSVSSVSSDKPATSALDQVSSDKPVTSSSDQGSSDKSAPTVSDEVSSSNSASNAPGYFMAICVVVAVSLALTISISVLIFLLFCWYHKMKMQKDSKSDGCFEKCHIPPNSSGTEEAVQQ